MGIVIACYLATAASQVRPHWRLDSDVVLERAFEIALAAKDFPAAKLISKLQGYEVD